jgi:hypothetical protein
MSTTPPTTTGFPPPPGARTKHSQIKLISHSNLFYWWPVWALAFFMALWTAIENHRLAILPAHAVVRKVKEVDPEGPVRRVVEVAPNAEHHQGDYLMTFRDERGHPRTTASLEAAAQATTDGKSEAFRPRISQEAWLGAVFTIGLVLTIAITNIPLRGLWSFVTLILIVVLILFISILQAWESIFEALGRLYIHINMAGYLFIGISVFVLWALATFIFDRQAYVIFTPGQIKVCEHIGAAVKTYDTYGIHMEKQRDDLFRHYILGFGSGDLVIRTAGAERNEIKLPNVLGIGWRLRTIEDMLRERATVVS